MKSRSETSIKDIDQQANMDTTLRIFRTANKSNETFIQPLH